jgi:hypothetical protein
VPTHPEDKSVKAHARAEMLLSLNRIEETSALNRAILSAQSADPQALVAGAAFGFRKGIIRRPWCGSKRPSKPP